MPSFNFVYVALSPGAKGNTVQLTKEVREAIGYALDYNGVVEFTVGGQGKLQAAPIPNGFPGTDGLPMPTQDVAKAKELLEKAASATASRSTPNFPNMNVYGVDLSLLMQKVQQDLAEVNIKVDLHAAGILGLARPCPRRRHSADGGVLCARLLRLGAVHPVLLA